MNHQDLVLLGGGHTHVLLIRELAMRPIPGVRLTLVSEQTLTPYSGMLPGYVAGHYSLEQTNIDLNQLCRRTGVRWIRARVTKIHPQERTLRLEGQADLQFDQLSIDIGSTPDLSIDGARQHALGVKPISGFQQRWQNLMTSHPNAEQARPEPVEEHWAVVGAGAGGVELVLAMAHSMRKRQDLHFHLVFKGERILPDYPRRVVAAVERQLNRLNIALHSNFSVAKVTQNALYENNGRQLPVDQSIWCTGATGASWLADSGLACNEKGFLLVNDKLQSVSHPSIFAVGDIAEMSHDPRPKAGVFAVRQAPHLAANLRRAFAGQPLKTVQLQTQFLSMLSLGDRSAVASRNGLVVSGAWVWRWKDHIDQKFMHQFSEFDSAMAGSEPTDSKAMQCAGCGSKLGPELLNNNLQQLGLNQQNGAEDAALWEPTPGLAQVQSIDGFRSFSSDDYRFGYICTNHALSDIHAMGATASFAQAWINLAFSHPRIQQRDHLRILQGIVDSLKAQNLALRGGHSTEGEELHVALVANGEVRAKAAWHKGGLQDGDFLVLSKALGTGVILAADMAGEATAPAVDAAMTSMMQSNQAAMQELKALGPSAVTDVTGFGLLGHLLEMIDASQQAGPLTARIDLKAIPLINGALELSRASWRSSLYPGLKPYLDRCEIALTEECADADSARIDLLLDPQTSGGLISGLSEDKFQQLTKSQSEFVLIGRIEGKTGDAEIIIN